jgi:hypothetical protein
MPGKNKLSIFQKLGDLLETRVDISRFLTGTAVWASCLFAIVSPHLRLYPGDHRPNQANFCWSQSTPSIFSRPSIQGHKSALIPKRERQDEQ